LILCDNKILFVWTFLDISLKKRLPVKIKILKFAQLVPISKGDLETVAKSVRTQERGFRVSVVR